MLTAATAGDAVRQAIASPAIDVLVCDVNVPGSGGRDLASQVGAGHAETRVVYISGFPRDAVEQLGIVTGAATFLEKPLSLASLIETVGALLQH